MSQPQSDTNRRDFLLGKSAVRALQDKVPGAENDAVKVPAPWLLPETYLVQVGRTAMACDFEIFLNAGQHAGGTEAAVAALDLVDQLESQMTVYRPSSELMSINRQAAVAPVAVERRLFGVLERALELYRATGGAFDITSGPLSRAWGFFRRAGRFPSADEIAEAMSRTGAQRVELNAQHATVRFQHPDLELNLNAIGKGYALDRCADLLEQVGVANFLLHGGQSSILARGSRATHATQGRGWLVSVKHPFRPQDKLAELWLLDRALGTSGAGRQFFHFQGRRYGHVIDPRTGWPADRVLSATVLAPDAATADALATALFVMGVEEAAKFCAQHPELGALLVAPGLRAGEVQLYTFGLPADQWRAV